MPSCRHSGLGVKLGNTVLCSPLHIPTRMDLYSALEHNPRNRRRVDTYRECSKYVPWVGAHVEYIEHLLQVVERLEWVLKKKKKPLLLALHFVAPAILSSPFPYINPRSFPSPTLSLSASRLANRQHLPPKKKHHHPSCSPYPSMQWQNPPPPPPPRYP